MGGNEYSNHCSFHKLPKGRSFLVVLKRLEIYARSTALVERTSSAIWSDSKTYGIVAIALGSFVLVQAVIKFVKILQK